MKSKIKMKSIILAGGKSTRMGQDKASMILGNTTVIQHVIKNLSFVFDEVYISGNQLSYKTSIDTIADVTEQKGPMGGIYSALEFCQEDIFVCSCDMPFVSPCLIHDFLEKTVKDKINVVRHGQKIYPVLGIYPFTILHDLKETIVSGNLRMTSFLEQQDAHYIDYDDSFENQLLNINTPENFYTAESFIKKKSTTMSKNYILLGGILLSLNVFSQEKTKIDSLRNYYEIQEVNIFGKERDEGPINKISVQTIQDFNKTNVVDAVNLLPGVSISQMGPRNEGSILVRGFSSLRTPIFFDGIPIYAPYDGNFDLSRFTTFDINSISVEKGLVSVQYGPNTLGGAVNIISKKPIKDLEINGQSGIGFADGTGVNSYFTALNIGSKQDKYYIMGSVSFLRVDNYLVSKKFEKTALQSSLKRVNSESMDVKLSAKFGYTPNKTDEYSLNIISQNANKGISPNALNTGNTNWRNYPIYDKKSIYLKTKTLVAKKTFLNFTGYYDAYYNKIKQYDDDQYILLNKNSSFSSVYDDYSLGGILSITTEVIKNNAITLSVNNKFDSHKEHNEEIQANIAIGQNYKAGEPIQYYRDNTFFVGLEDVITINSFLKTIIGASYNSRNNIKAQEYGTHYMTGEKNVLYDFPNGSNNAFDYKAGIIVEPAKNHLITISASKRSRFASQKERYSSRLGSQVPNPDLKSEYTWAYDITYSARVGKKFNYEISCFINDIKDAILARTVGALDNGNTISQNVNIGKAVFQGYELAFGYTLIKNLTLGANYSYIDMKDKTEGSNEKFIDVPNHKMMTYAKLNIPKLRSILNVNMEFYGKRYTTSTGNQAPEFTLVNAKLSVGVIKGVNLDFSVRNLFDRNYYLSYGYPKEGRSFMTALSYNF